MPSPKTRPDTNNSATQPVSPITSQSLQQQMVLVSWTAGTMQPLQNCNSLGDNRRLRFLLKRSRHFEATSPASAKPTTKCIRVLLSAGSTLAAGCPARLPSRHVTGREGDSNDGRKISSKPPTLSFPRTGPVEAVAKLTGRLSCTISHFSRETRLPFITAHVKTVESYDIGCLTEAMRFGHLHSMAWLSVGQTWFTPVRTSAIR